MTTEHAADILERLREESEDSLIEIEINNGNLSYSLQLDHKTKPTVGNIYMLESFHGAKPYSGLTYYERLRLMLEDDIKQTLGLIVELSEFDGENGSYDFMIKCFSKN